MINLELMHSYINVCSQRSSTNGMLGHSIPRLLGKYTEPQIAPDGWCMSAVSLLVGMSAFCMASPRMGMWMCV